MERISLAAASAKPSRGSVMRCDVRHLPARILTTVLYLGEQAVCKELRDRAARELHAITITRQPGGPPCELPD